MPDHVVADAGPLIALARIEELELIRRLWERVLVPRRVWEEVVESSPDAPGAAEVRAARQWMEVKEVEEERVAPIAVMLDQGEAEALALTMEHEGATLLVDDLRARKVAAKIRVEMIGTVGLLLRAKKRGYLDRVEGPLRKVQAVGLYLSESLVLQVLTQAGEVPESGSR